MVCGRRHAINQPGFGALYLHDHEVVRSSKLRACPRSLSYELDLVQGVVTVKMNKKSRKLPIGGR
jgi:hypothetical protein